MMKYKGYEGQAVYDEQAKLFHGDVIGLKDVITFQGTSVEELEQAFKDSIDDYLSWTYTIETDHDKKGKKVYVVKVNELPGVSTDASTIKEAFENIKEAIALSCEMDLESNNANSR